MRFDTLKDWLSWQETLNPAEIELGLGRVTEVLIQIGHPSTFNCPLITVAGTNGKGSVVAMLETMAISAGLRVCSYTSPHLFSYNERIKIDGQPVNDETLCEAFERIDNARQDKPLTYFEFGTLAAIDIFFRQQPDLVLLEVGLGGRLDAVNIMHADVSVLTSVAIDHVDWLGSDRESIGTEKAGIFRQGKPVVCGEVSPPKSVIRRAAELNCTLYLNRCDYQVIQGQVNSGQEDQKLTGDTDKKSWKYHSRFESFADLPLPSLAGEFQCSNAATAIMALQVLIDNGRLSALESGDRFRNAVERSLPLIPLAGRFQQISQQPAVFVDVAHNLQAAQSLASLLRSERSTHTNGVTKTWAIVAMLADKDIDGVLQCVSSEIDHWCFAGLENVARGISAQVLVDGLSASFLKKTKQKNPCKIASDLQGMNKTVSDEQLMYSDTVTRACDLVLSKTDKNDRVIIFGSFYTVAEAMHYFSEAEMSD